MKYEDRHRELREAAQADGRLLGDAGLTHLAFVLRTGLLVVDLVAAVRQWADIKHARVDFVGDERMRNELLGQKIEQERRVYCALVALDEAASRG